MSGRMALATSGTGRVSVWALILKKKMNKSLWGNRAHVCLLHSTIDFDGGKIIFRLKI